jgi:phage anti-repressor protein
MEIINKLISARDIYTELGIRKEFSHWIHQNIIRAGLEEVKDFLIFRAESTGGRPAIEYHLTRDASLAITLISGGKNAKKVRDDIIDLFNQRKNFELITVKEAAFAIKVINCLKYVENQKQAYTLHLDKYVAKNIDYLNPKFIYAEFAKHRSNIIGWDKISIDQAIDKYISEHSGYNRSHIDKQSMSTKLSIIDIGEAIRVATLDILYSKETDANLANRFSKLCKEMANEMQVHPEKENKTTLFREKESIENIKQLKIQ